MLCFCIVTSATHITLHDIVLHGKRSNEGLLFVPPLGKGENTSTKHLRESIYSVQTLLAAVLTAADWQEVAGQ